MRQTLTGRARSGRAIARGIESLERRQLLASITNGSFETPALASGFTTLQPGNTTLTGWTITGSTVAHVHDSTWKAKAGNRSLDLLGGPTSAISQNITGLTANTPYRITFWMSRNMYVGQTTVELKVAANSTSQTYLFNAPNVTTADPKWSQRSFDFTPTGTSVTLKFERFNVANSGAAALDDIKIVALQAAEAEVRGNNTVINDNDTTPASSDHTDFGTVPAGSPFTRTFTVRNTGNIALTTSGLTVPSGFSIDASDTLAGSIPAGGQDTFKVKLNATAAGTFQGNISFANNDASENPYNFAIKGVVTQPFATIASNVVTLTGTSGNDSIRASIANNVLTLRLNAFTPLTFNNASSITRLVVNAGGGNDSIVMAPSMNRPTSLNGGDGDDLIIAGNGTDVINGGTGTDIATKNGSDTTTLVEEVMS
jgi:choice-of-anchor C domain-containing protein